MHTYIQLVARYVAQFRSDSRRLLEEMNTGYAEDFGKVFTELIDKYLLDFHQGVSHSREACSS